MNACANNNNNNNIWTPSMRQGFIKRAMHSDVERGSHGSYWYNVLPKITKPDEESPKKAVATRTLMNTIFGIPDYRIFALKIYDILVNKLLQNPFTRGHFNKNIVVQMKGGTSYTYAMGANDMFPYSDLDIVVCINPFLSPEFFHNLKETVGTLVLQSMSQYKRSMDFMFFNGKERLSPEMLKDMKAKEQFVPDELIHAFMADYRVALTSIEDDEGVFVSPFENVEFRNIASRFSCVILDAESDTFPDSVVRVEVPHYDGCERIPLRKTPLFCSHNKTIRFNRAANPDDKPIVGAFDLFRLRFNNLFIPDPVVNEDGTKGRFRKENVTADFIDISLPDRDDAELIDFWCHGRTCMVKDDATNIWIVIPDLKTMVSDLYKMLFVYECPDSKKDKRLIKYEALKRELDAFDVDVRA